LDRETKRQVDEKMTDIVEKLSEYVAGNSEEYKLIVESKETIQKLRAALREIGFDYVELSYDKIKYLYLEHMVIARNAYQKSFPEQPPVKNKPLDDNF
jgi:acetylornithine deacetylase/succinyl-diaminopimelate desuccinylase-like protein